MPRQWWSRDEWAPWMGFGSGRGSRFFDSGEMPLAILSLLAEGPKHGYQIMKELEDRSGGWYRASAGSVYPTLQQLEDQGLVDVVQENGKRVYSINDEGRAELERNAAVVEGIWKRAAKLEDWGRWMGPEVAVMAGPLAKLMKVTFRAVMRAGDDLARQAAIRDILDAARRDLEDV